MAVYNEMIAELKQAVKQNKNLVLDATFYNNDIRKMFLEEIKDNDDIIFIEIRAEEHLIRERLKKTKRK